MTHSKALPSTAGPVGSLTGPRMAGGGAIESLDRSYDCFRA